VPEPPPRPPPQLQPKLPPRLPPKLPPVKKIPSAPAVVAGAGARLLTSAPGMVARARAHARQGPAAVAPPERHPGPAQMYVPERMIRGRWGVVGESEARSR
jgi:hypothetical protein